MTTTTGSIPVLDGLARLDGVGLHDFATVRHLYSGGAPVPPSTVERFHSDFGQYIHNNYGMTETTSACIGAPPGAETPVHEATGSLAIGLPYPALEVGVADPDGNPVPKSAVFGEAMYTAGSVASARATRPSLLVTGMECPACSPGPREHTGEPA